MILPDRAPVAARQETFVISGLQVNVMCEHWDHVFVSLAVKVVGFVSFVEDVPHHLRWRRIDDGRGYNISHVTMIMVLGYA